MSAPLVSSLTNVLHRNKCADELTSVLNLSLVHLVTMSRLERCHRLTKTHTTGRTIGDRCTLVTRELHIDQLQQGQFLVVLT